MTCMETDVDELAPWDADRPRTERELADEAYRNVQDAVQEACSYLPDYVIDRAVMAGREFAKRANEETQRGEE